MADEQLPDCYTFLNGGWMLMLKPENKLQREINRLVDVRRRRDQQLADEAARTDAQRLADEMHEMLDRDHPCAYPSGGRKKPGPARLRYAHAAEALLEQVHRDYRAAFRIARLFSEL